MDRTLLSTVARELLREISIEQVGQACAGLAKDGLAWVGQQLPSPATATAGAMLSTVAPVIPVLLFAGMTVQEWKDRKQREARLNAVEREFRVMMERQDDQSHNLPDEVVDRLRTAGVFTRLSGADRGDLVREVRENVSSLLKAAGLEDAQRVEVLRIYAEDASERLRSIQHGLGDLAAGVGQVLDGNARLEQIIDGVVGALLSQLQQKDTQLQEMDAEVSTLRDQLRAAVLARVEAERHAGRSPDAVLEELRHGQPEGLLRFLDRYVDEDERRLIERHRERAAVAYVVGDIDRALGSIEKILCLLPDDLDALTRRGHIRRKRGDLAAAEADYKCVLKLASDERSRAVACGNVGLLALVRDDLDTAQNYSEEALSVGESLGNLEIISNSLGNLGTILRIRRDLGAAAACHHRALLIDESLGRREGMASELGNLGLIEQFRENLDAAEKYHKRSLAIFESLEYREGIANQLGNLGLLAEKRGQFAEARALWTQARELFAAILMPHMVDKVQRALDELPSA